MKNSGNKPIRLVVMVSGGGSNLLYLLRECKNGQVPAQVVAVGADRPAAACRHAQAFKVPFWVCPFQAYTDRGQWGKALLKMILDYRPDLVVLSGFMRLLPPETVEALSPNIINTHPAYLPEFPGAHAVKDALAAGVKQTGASVIMVGKGVDDGPIIYRERVKIYPADKENVLHERIKRVERRLLCKVISEVATGRLRLGT